MDALSDSLVQRRDCGVSHFRAYVSAVKLVAGIHIPPSPFLFHGVSLALSRLTLLNLPCSHVYRSYIHSFFMDRLSTSIVASSSCCILRRRDIGPKARSCGTLGLSLRINEG